jgi:8-oxo-dGTP pyrophosphatase MutT (NUDIX family)
MAKTWKTLTSKIVYKNSWITVHEDQVKRPNGENGIYAVVRTNGPSVIIVAINKNNEVYFIKIDRYTTPTLSLELPGGGTDKKEILLHAAQRELQEETGLTAKKWAEVGSAQPMNGITDEVMHVFIAQDLVQTPQDQQAEEGIARIQKIPLQEVAGLIKSGSITDSQTITAFTLACLYLGVSIK